MKHLTPKRRADPDFYAKSIRISAEKITRPEKFRRSEQHHAGRVVARGKVRLAIQDQYPNSDRNLKRPDQGTILEGECATVEARKITVSRGKDKRDHATASKGVEIFGKLRRSKP